MTLQYLAQKVGTTAQTIQRLETGNMTVSLDWLQRIADAFGVPAAALIVSETTASVQVLGTVDATGELVPANDKGQTETLSLVIAAPRPVAVRVGQSLAAFEAGTVLIGDKTDFDPEFLSVARDSLVGLASGRVMFRRVTTGVDGTVLEAPINQGLREEPADAIVWIAPILMAVRYF